MNRIYQGRVTKVEVPDGKGWKQFDDNPKKAKEKWQAMLWRHHQLFQDAVNYYTLALAAMAAGLPKEHSMSQLRKQMEACWTQFPKKTSRAAQYLQKSVVPWLGLDNNASFQDACDSILPSSEVPIKLANQVVELMSRDLEGTSDIGNYGKSEAPKFLNPRYQGNFRDEFARKSIETLEFRLSVHGLSKRLLDEFGALSLATASQREGREVRVGVDNRNALIKHIKKLVNENLLTVEEGEELNGRLAEQTDEALIEIPAYEAGGASHEKSLGIPALLLGKQLGFSPPVLRCLKKTIARPTERWEEQLQAAREAATHDEDPLRTIRNLRGGYVFKAFTGLQYWEQSADGKPFWLAFDIAAFKEALKTINQFNLKTEERRKRRQEVEDELNFMMGENPNWKPKLESTEDDQREVPVLHGDLRYYKLVQLLTDMDSEGAERTIGKIYGPSRASLRGFGKLREAWKDLFDKSGGKLNETDLRNEVANLQREQKLDMGYTALFLKLCEPGNWVLWRDATAAEEKERTSHKWARNVLYAAVEARELAEELERLKSPIRYTPAEPEFSRRLFMFSDIVGVDGAKYRGENTVEVSAADIDDNGKYGPRRILLHYSAPRIIRDELNDGTDSKWLQPMMAALGLETEDQASLNKRAAVALMPDFSKRNRELRVLLNFPVDLNIDKLVARIGKTARWEKQINTAYEKNKLKQRFHLIWPRMKLKETQKPDQYWWDNPDIRKGGLTCLAIDMGQRRAADFTILHAGASNDSKSFVELGTAGDTSWFAKLIAQGSLRLPGEDMKTRREQTAADRELLRKRGKDPTEDAGKKERIELYGCKGRTATLDEYRQAFSLAKRLLHDENAVALEGKARNWIGEHEKKLSFPEQNDKLINLYHGALSRYRTWHRWSWRLSQEYQAEWGRTYEEIKKVPYYASWSNAASREINSANVNELRALIVAETNSMRALLEDALLQIAHRVLPLRERSWRWTEQPLNSDDKPLHLLSPDGEPLGEIPWLHGQRGLSIARIEQLENFRRAVLSLNRLLRHRIGEKPEFGSQTRGQSLPDPCSEITDKIVRIKEERVNQTAHMIIGQALGVRLKPHSISNNKRERADMHGEYEVIPGRSPVDFIVLEDLSRYITDKSRSRSENSRLMKWCHRAINDKVKLLAEPFGIPVLEVFASYSSKFDSRTGAPGFRATEVTAADKLFWQRVIDKQIVARAVFDCLDHLATKGQNNVRLVLPQNGGPLFIAAVNDDQPLPNIKQADINAAINIGLRAIAGPTCYHAYPRVRLTKKTSGSNKGKWVTRRDNKREGAQFSTTAEVVFLNLNSDSNVLKGESTNLFHDPMGIATYGFATIKDYQHPPLVHASAVFSRQKDANGKPHGAVARLEWEICRRFNNDRLKKSGLEIGADAAISYLDKTDEIPF